MRTVTSITIVPPLPLQAIAVPLLRRYAYDCPRRLPAHISVLYPFVPVDELDAACATLRDLCADVPPFALTVRGFGQFTGVIYMAVEPSAALDDLMARVRGAFPQCIPYDGMFGDKPPPPHITVGVFNSARKQAQASLPPYKPLTFTVRRLTVSVGTPDKIVPWLVQDVIALKAAP